jgi:hypothetical protein
LAFAACAERLLTAGGRAVLRCEETFTYTDVRRATPVGGHCSAHTNRVDTRSTAPVVAARAAFVPTIEQKHTRQHNRQERYRPVKQPHQVTWNQNGRLAVADEENPPLSTKPSLAHRVEVSSRETFLRSVGTAIIPSSGKFVGGQEPK